MDAKTNFKDMVYIRWSCDKFLSEVFFVEDEDLEELNTLLKPFTNQYTNTTPIYNYQSHFDYLTFLDDIIDNIILKVELNGINKALLKRYYMIEFELDYINNFMDLEDLNELSVCLKDSLQQTTLIKTYETTAQKNTNNYEGLYSLINNTLQTEIQKTINGHYKR